MISVNYKLMRKSYQPGCARADRPDNKQKRVDI